MEKSVGKEIINNKNKKAKRERERETKKRIKSEKCEKLREIEGRIENEIHAAVPR